MMDPSLPGNVGYGESAVSEAEVSGAATEEALRLGTQVHMTTQEHAKGGARKIVLNEGPIQQTVNVSRRAFEPARIDGTEE